MVNAPDHAAAVFTDRTRDPAITDSSRHETSAGRDAAREAAQDRGAARRDEDGRGARGSAAGRRADPCAARGASGSRARGGVSVLAPRSVETEAVPGAVPPVRAHALPRAWAPLQHGAATGAEDVSRAHAVAGVSCAFGGARCPPAGVDGPSDPRSNRRRRERGLGHGAAEGADGRSAGSAGKQRRRGRERWQRGTIADVELGMRGEHAVGQELAEPVVRPTLHDEFRREVEVCTWVDVMRDAGRDDAEDRRRPLAAVVEPCEEPIFPAEDQPSKLALAAIIGELDVAVLEKEREALPLAMEVSERTSERGLRWCERAVLVEPDTALLDDGLAVLDSPDESLLGVVAGELRDALDLEQRSDQADPLERDQIATAGCLDEPPSSMTHAARPFSTCPLDAIGDARAVALNGAGHVIAEEVAHALGVAVRRVEEADPASVGPTPHGAGADAIGDARIEHGDAGGVRTEVAGGSSLLGDEIGHGLEQVDVRVDAAAECLGCDLDSGTGEADALSLDRVVLDVLVAGRLDDERVAERSALDDRGRRRRRDDGVVGRACDGLVDAALDEEPCRHDIHALADRVGNGLQLLAAPWPAPEVVRAGMFISSCMEGRRPG